MTTTHTRRDSEAFVIVELFIIIVIVAIMVVFFTPSFLKPKYSGVHITCSSNLRQIGLAFQIWQTDNGNLFPMKALTNSLGQQEFASGILAYRYFQAISNELNNPKILICPADKDRTAATNFTTDFNGTHVSYFLGLDADGKWPQMLLSGDSNLTNGTKVRDGIMMVTTNRPAGWTGERHENLGNIALADASVQQWDTSALHKGIMNTGAATNRLLFP